MSSHKGRVHSGNRRRNDFKSLKFGETYGTEGGLNTRKDRVHIDQPRGNVVSDRPQHREQRHISKYADTKQYRHRFTDSPFREFFSEQNKKEWNEKSCGIEHVRRGGRRDYREECHSLDLKSQPQENAAFDRRKHTTQRQKPKTEKYHGHSADPQRRTFPPEQNYKQWTEKMHDINRETSRHLGGKFDALDLSVPATLNFHYNTPQVVDTGSNTGNKRPDDFKCPKCDDIFDTERGLNIHQGKVHGGQPKVNDVKCPECGETFGSERGLNIHCGKKHGVNGRSNFNCPECDNTFDTERELNIHHGTVHGVDKKREKPVEREQTICPIKKQEDACRIKRKDVSPICQLVNEFIGTFKEQLDELTGLRWDSLSSGSYYEKTKISKADEFDFLIFPKEVSVSVDFRKKSVPGYYKVEMISTRIQEMEVALNENGYVIPEYYKNWCFELFEKAIKSIRRGRRIKRKPKSPGSPAYSILYDLGAGITDPIDIDLVPGFKVDGWPEVARRINPSWIEADKVVNNSMTSYDVVCKACPINIKEKELLWRLSFAKTEKMLMTFANSNDDMKFKKNAYKCLKLCIEDVKKTSGKEFKWSSYNLKHFMLRQYDNWPTGNDDKVSIQREVIHNLIQQLSKPHPVIKNYFIDNENVVETTPRDQLDLIVNGLREQLTKL